MRKVKNLQWKEWQKLDQKLEKNKKKILYRQCELKSKLLIFINPC